MFFFMFFFQPQSLMVQKFLSRMVDSTGRSYGFDIRSVVASDLNHVMNSAM